MEETSSMQSNCFVQTQQTESSQEISVKTREVVWNHWQLELFSFCILKKSINVRGHVPTSPKIFAYIYNQCYIIISFNITVHKLNIYMYEIWKNTTVRLKQFQKAIYHSGPSGLQRTFQVASCFNCMLPYFGPLLTRWYQPGWSLEVPPGDILVLSISGWAWRSCKSQSFLSFWSFLFLKKKTSVHCTIFDQSLIIRKQASCSGLRLITKILRPDNETHMVHLGDGTDTVLGHRRTHCKCPSLGKIWEFFLTVKCSQQNPALFPYFDMFRFEGHGFDSIVWLKL